MASVHFGCGAAHGRDERFTKLTARPPTRNPIHKALQILCWMADASNDTYGVREIAAAVGLAVGTTHRLLAILEEDEFVARTEEGKYQLGLEMLRVSSAVTDKASIVDISRPYLEQLVRDCGETAILGLYSRARGEMMFALVVDSPNPLRYAINQHQWIPSYAAASGLAIVSFLSLGERHEILSSNVAPLTSRTMTDTAQIAAEMDQVRRRGYAVSMGQRTEGAVGIAAPIFRKGGSVIGDVLLTIPEHRFDPADEDALALKVVKTAKNITQQVG